MVWALLRKKVDIDLSMGVIGRDRGRAVGTGVWCRLARMITESSIRF